MASQQVKSSQQFNPYLSPNQQDLLLAALNSQATQKTRAKAAPGDTGITNQTTSAVSQHNSTTMSGTAVFQSPGTMDNFNPDFTPDLDYLDGDGSFDFDNADLGGEMIGGLPGLDADGNPEQHEKRKNTDEDGSPEEGDAKRQELGEGEKGSKKPGRKPLTNEPTTKRKAQNRAAQRAFRERKEKHLKDLETRVSELAKAREADQHENGLLKAQVDRLQGELKDYRKRLSLNGHTGRGSPPSVSYSNQSRANTGSTNGQNNFQFDFPKFGGLPSSQFLQNASQSGTANNSERGSVTPPVKNQSPGANVAYNAPAQQPVLNRANSAGNSLSPGSLQSGGSTTGSPSNSSNLSNGATYNFAPYSTNDNMHGFATTLPQMSGGGNDPFGDLFSPSILKTVGHSGNGYFNPNQQNPTAPVTTVNNGGDSTAGIPDNRVFRFNSTSNTSDSASPSASSLSQWNANGTANSSCGTSPEPSHESPLNKDKPNDTYEKSNLQNTYNINSAANTNNAFMSNQYSNNSNNFGAFDLGNSNPAYNVPQLDSFDPVLFGDYRDTSQDNMFGGAEFNNDFFNEALTQPGPVDYSSPSNLFGILQNLPQTTQQTSTAPAPSRNLMAEMDKTRDGGDDDYGLPASLQSNPATQKSQQTTATKKDSSGKLISCNNIWNQLQSNPDFQDGKFDLDGLCSELRAKARCSESGVMVDSDHVDQALKKLGKTREEVERDNLGPPEAEGQAHLMFEQDSWDKVLKNLGGSTRS